MNLYKSIFGVLGDKDGIWTGDPGKHIIAGYEHFELQEAPSKKHNNLVYKSGKIQTKTFLSYFWRKYLYFNLLTFFAKLISNVPTRTKQPNIH